MSWRTLLAIDHDKHAFATYAANFPSVRVECGEVRDFIHVLPDADVIIGGPPCQPFSQAGDRKGNADERDGVPDFINAVGRKRPRMFLMEQVPGFLTFQGGRYARSIFTQLESLGYRLDVRTLDAVNFGVPQFRERCWWWGIRNDAKARHCWPKATHAWPPPEACMFGGELQSSTTVREALSLWESPFDAQTDTKQHRTRRPVDEPSTAIAGDDRRVLIHLMQEGHGIVLDRPLHLNEPSPTMRQSLVGCSDIIVQYRWSDAMLAKHPPASPASPAPTVQAKWFKGGAEGLLAVTAWKQKGELWVRRLSPLECARLQSVPDDFRWPEKISRTAAYRIIGNGWASGIAWHLSQALKNADPRSETVIDLFCGGGLGAVGWHGRFWSYEAETAGASC